MITIVAGIWKGKQLPALPHDARPVSQKTRAAIFSTLGERLVAATVLDLFAGSGALGLEALSRGADTVTFVDKSVTALKQNCRAVSSPNISVVQSEAAKFVSKDKGLYDIIFMDPPYAELKLDLVEQALDLLKSDGVLVLSCSSKTVIDAHQFSIAQHKIYGDTQILYLQQSIH
jgi:16S rRNA (guanine966-N2)-methyltransferase